jgi:hypothetical protein
MSSSRATYHPVIPPQLVFRVNITNRPGHGCSQRALNVYRRDFLFPPLVRLVG